MNNWTTEWPNEPGRFWLYGRVWGDKEPKLYHVEVWQISNGLAFICSGHFLGKNDCEDTPQWQPINLPDLPKPIAPCADAQ